MPVRMIAQLQRRPDLTPAQFRAHYETVHMPLLRRVLGARFPARHTRRYVDRARVLAGPPGMFAFDALVELEFASEAALQALLAAMAEEPVARAIAADEPNFLAGPMGAVVVRETWECVGSEAAEGGSRAV